MLAIILGGEYVGRKAPRTIRKVDRKPMKMRADKVSRKKKETMKKKKPTKEEPCGFIRRSSWGSSPRRFFTNNAAEPRLLETLCRMSNNNPVCVLRKKLTPTDIDGDQNRLQVSKKEFDKGLRTMMTKEEEEQVKDGINGLKVTVFDALAREYRMTFKLVSNKYYRFITTDYKRFVRNNQLNAGETLDVWACRQRGQQGGGSGEVEVEGESSKEGELLLAMLRSESSELEEEVPMDEDEKIIEAALTLMEMASSCRR